MPYPSEVSCSQAAGQVELDQLATCLVGQNSIGDFVETLFEQSVEFDSLTFGVAVVAGGLKKSQPSVKLVMFDQKWPVQHVLDCYYLNKASAELALMKGLLGQNTSFADEEALKI